MSGTTQKLSKKDFKSDQDVRWCPGCGDYAILNSVQATFANLGLDRSKTVIVSGIGCSSRFPYYMSTYGFHTIHGRAPAIATGVKLSNPELNVWVVTGDGDALSIGGNHFIHALRRNVNLKILLFNNRIYGLTKGQYSPTSDVGTVTKSTPMGSLDNPFHPVTLALGARATFVARTVDVFSRHLQETLAAAATHEGTAFVEILQNCPIFNDGVYSHVTERDAREENVVELREGKPLIYGKEKDKGIRINCNQVEKIQLGNGVGPDDCLVWDPTVKGSFLPYMMAELPEEEFPTPIGIFRRIEERPFEKGVHDQIEMARERFGEGDLESVIYAGDTWTVE